MDFISQFDLNSLLEFISNPSFKTVQLASVIYIGLLWLFIIVWVTRDAIHRSESLLFQVIAILMNIIFPILGILLYLILRPGKTTTERYYEELEHRLILETIGEEDTKKKAANKKVAKKTTKKKE